MIVARPASVRRSRIRVGVLANGVAMFARSTPVTRYVVVGPGRGRRRRRSDPARCRPSPRRRADRPRCGPGRSSAATGHRRSPAPTPARRRRQSPPTVNVVAEVAVFVLAQHQVVPVVRTCPLGPRGNDRRTRGRAGEDRTAAEQFAAPECRRRVRPSPVSSPLGSPHLSLRTSLSHWAGGGTAQTALREPAG